MTDPRPSLAQQIQAVEWAELHAREMARRSGERDSVAQMLRSCLTAAAETLRMLEHGKGDR